MAGVNARSVEGVVEGILAVGSDWAAHDGRAGGFEFRGREGGCGDRPQC